jgi:hypothetical protein
MRRLLPFRAAGWALIALLGAACIFQLVVLAGFIPTEMVWGGRLSNAEERTIGAIVSLSTLILMISVVVLRLKATSVCGQLIGRYGAWAMVFLFALNTVGNLFALDERETWIFTPITALSAFLAWRVAVGEGKS